MKIYITSAALLFSSTLCAQNVGIGTTTPAYKLDVFGIINTNTEYRLSGKSFFRWGNLVLGLYRNTYSGDSAGISNSTGYSNTFIGGGAGRFNSIGYRNCFLGTHAGYWNVSGYDNTFIGSQAGQNTTGFQNTFLGSLAGISNTTGYSNSFLGIGAGSNNTIGIQNTFVGSLSGFYHETGRDNTFIGEFAGETNISGSQNTLLGASSDLGSSNLTNATAIGFKAYAMQNNSLILGSINGVNGATEDTRVGIGTTFPSEKLDVAGNIKFTGEINRTPTGTANLVPVAYGTISSGAVIHSGTGNFTVSKTGTGSYSITITDHSYSFSTYSTLVTTFGLSPHVPITDSFLGNLLIRVYNLSGALIDNGFQFVVYRQ